MAAAGKPVSHEFRTSWSPEEALRSILLQAVPLGYSVEHHTADVAILARRFTPTNAWAVPLYIAGIIFGMGVFAPNASVASAEIAGRLTLIAVILAGVLALAVKTTERVTFSATAEEQGSRVVVSGAASPRLRNYVLAWGATPEAPKAA